MCTTKEIIKYAKNAGSAVAAPQKYQPMNKLTNITAKVIRRLISYLIEK